MIKSCESDPEFTKIFGRYHGRIHRYVVALLPNRAEAEDITQETFLRAYRKLSTLRDPGGLSSWLYRIATNLCYDSFRQTASRPQTQELGGPEDQDAPAMVDSDSPRLDQALARQEMSTCVQRYLEDLPDHYRAVIMLHDLEGLTNAEIATMLGCSLATAKIRLHRARQKLRTILGEVCEVSVDKRGVTVCRPKSSRRFRT